MAPSPQPSATTSIISGSHSNTDAESGDALLHRTSYWEWLNQDVDPNDTTFPLTAYSFMTGYMDVISFSACFVWCGFQTGNFCQLAIAIARLYEGPKLLQDHTFRTADKQALTSLLSFQVGSAFGRLGDRIGNHKRIYLVLGTFLQALLTMAAALTLWKSHQPSVSNDRDDPAWTNILTFVGLAFMSASLGVQGVIGKRLNTQFGTTIVLTTIWVELASDPNLFKLNRKVPSRDHKLFAASFLFIGGFLGRSLVGSIGTPAALGIGCGARVLIALSFLFCKTKEPKPDRIQ
ncbi:hypothetical protein BDN72DRAFT_849404 [Pluteus cervinus]|uniref:Uncharacterized protein n=1 Tax=Pluteus cervinus TaxID=181527 RepID=A0ACD3A796_9AGAR|nr:hypothetical protein BDN72DRAFT_849404 [Pluteus cervinus]